MPQVYKAIAGDTTTKLRITCCDAVTKLPISLSGRTVNILWRIDGGSVVTKAMSIVDSPNGVVEYQFLTTELAAGLMEAEIEVTETSSSKKNISFKFNMTVEPRV